MRCPDASGKRHTLRSLADTTGVSKSKLNSMIHGHQLDVTAEQALAIAEAVGVQRGALFTPKTFVIANANSLKGGTR
jgi:DNA-binding transcriptional regulator YdaS (Cro superfamily)